MGGRCPQFCRPRTQVPSYVGRASERKVGYRSGPENLKVGGWEGGSSQGEQGDILVLTRSVGREAHQFLQNVTLTWAGPGVKTSSPRPHVKLSPVTAPLQPCW